MINSFLGSLIYYPLKLFVTITSLFYFKKIRVVGLGNIPTKGPVIYAITHQNSLLDAYLSNGFSWRSPYYLVRADIFKHKTIDKLMRSIRTLPVYRIRDGYDSIKKNDQIFDTTKEIMIKGGVVAIFPEGSHSMTHRLRPLKKGIARMAFMAEAVTDFNLNIQIVPFGINYDSYLKSSSRTLVNVGKPISMADYKQSFLEDENKAFRLMLTDLSLKMKSLIVHIDSANYNSVYQEYQKQRIYKKSLLKQLKSDQELVRCIELGEEFADTADKIPTLIQLIKNTFYMLRLGLGYIPKSIVQLIVKKTVKDKNFIAAVSFTYSIFIYPFFYVIAYFLLKIAIHF